MKELTSRQREILQFISDYIENNSFPPTVRETAAHFSVSIKAIQDHFTALSKKGYLFKDEKRSRSLKVLGNVNKKTREGYKIPVLGSVAAGKPIFCEENYEDTIYLSEPFTRKLDRMVAKKAAAKMGYRRINKNQRFATNWREFTA